jgi:23S rRNA pseudouridine1911/1915/1917 synthase
MTLHDRLSRDFPNAKRQTLKRMVQNRRVMINGIVARRLDQAIKSEDRIVVDAARQKIASPPRLPFVIVHEDLDILVIDKPAGLLTSTVPREPRPTAIAAVREYLRVADPAARAGLIHRLDRDASGLLVFSKNNPAFDSLKKQFFHHSVSRFYHAIVSPAPKKPSRRIESFLVERADGSVHSARGAGRGQRAVTTFDVAKCRGRFALLRIKLHTGRKHQIRVHLSEIGSPVLGDVQYGGKPHKKGIMLAAVELAFDHPRTGKRAVFTIPAASDRIVAEFIAIGAECESI